MIIKKIPFPILLVTIISITLIMMTGCQTSRPSVANEELETRETVTTIIKTTPSPSFDMASETPTNQPSLTPELEVEQRAFPYLRGINLGNALDAPAPGAWGVTIKDEHIPIIQSAGFNAVRLPARFSAHTSEGPDYSIDAEFLALVDQIVNVCIDSGFILILDLHHFEEIMDTPQTERDRFLAIWKQLAEHYQNAPPELYFELLNEPSKNLDSKTWNILLQDAIRIIRETNPDRKILVGGINFSDINALYELELPQDDNLIATFHYYSPFNFTHQGASWVAGSSEWKSTTWDGTLTDKMRIATDFDRAAIWALQNKTPIIMSEFGTINQADQSSRVRWTQFVVQEAEKRKISWIYWDFYTEFSIVDLENEAWDKSFLLALFGQ
jgi:endoglucanase